MEVRILFKINDVVARCPLDQIVLSALFIKKTNYETKPHVIVGWFTIESFVSSSVIHDAVLAIVISGGTT